MNLMKTEEQLFALKCPVTQTRLSWCTMKKRSVNVLLVDDHTLYREGLRGLIDHWEEVAVIGEAENGEQALEFCQAHSPDLDLILMDIQMPGMGGIEASRLIHDEFPEIAILILTMSLDEENLFNAINYGVRGYVLKDIPARQLRNEIRSIMRGEAVLSNVATARVFEKINVQTETKKAQEDSVNLIAHLTEDEIQLMKLISQGLSNDEIASRQFLSEAGVKKKLTNLMHKLSLENRVQVAVYATRAGLTEKPEQD